MTEKLPRRWSKRVFVSGANASSKPISRIVCKGRPAASSSAVVSSALVCAPPAAAPESRSFEDDAFVSDADPLRSRQRNDVQDDAPSSVRTETNEEPDEKNDAASKRPDLIDEASEEEKTDPGIGDPSAHSLPPSPVQEVPST